MRIPAVVFVLFSAIAAQAQTAEETVSYIVAGAEENPWQKTGDSPLSYTIQRENGDITIAVTAVSDCVFDVKFDATAKQDNKTRGVSYRIDFSRVSDIQPSREGFDGFSTYTIPGALVDCKGEHDYTVGLKNKMLFVSNASPHRAEKAIAYLRSEYCKGSPF